MSAAVIDKEKVYKAINGEEALDLILAEFHRQLVNSGLFPLHRVWHEFEIAGGVRVKGWSTRTEDVKFKVGQNGGHPNNSEEVSASIAVQLGPAPPDLLREQMEQHACPRCGRISGSKAGNVAHQRFCKAEILQPIIEFKTPENETAEPDIAETVAPVGASD